MQLTHPSCMLISGPRSYIVPCWHLLIPQISGCDNPSGIFPRVCSSHAFVCASEIAMHFRTSGVLQLLWHDECHAV